MLKEIRKEAVSGLVMVAVLFVVQLFLLYLFRGFVLGQNNVGSATMALLNLLVFVCWFGLFMVEPNEGRILLLFGKYKGTVANTGLRWANPFYMKKSVSLRVRNFETEKLKVNEHNGSPIEIAAIVVWKVVDTAEAIFEVDNYNDYVRIQSEAALRVLASSYPYDPSSRDGVSLRGSTNEVSERLQKEIQERLGRAGIEVIEARISHLAYAPEIASAMLQRQQASAIIAAREIIVEGAVGMVDMALKKIESGNIVKLEAREKANMVSNLLVVLCGERGTQPTISTGNPNPGRD